MKGTPPSYTFQSAFSPDNDTSQIYRALGFFQNEGSLDISLGAKHERVAPTVSSISFDQSAPYRSFDYIPLPEHVRQQILKQGHLRNAEKSESFDDEYGRETYEIIQEYASHHAQGFRHTLLVQKNQHDDSQWNLGKDKAQQCDTIVPMAKTVCSSGGTNRSKTSCGKSSSYRKQAGRAKNKISTFKTSTIGNKSQSTKAKRIDQRKQATQVASRYIGARYSRLRNRKNQAGGAFPTLVNLKPIAPGAKIKPQKAMDAWKKARQHPIFSWPLDPVAFLGKLSFWASKEAKWHVGIACWCGSCGSAGNPRAGGARRQSH